MSAGENLVSVRPAVDHLLLGVADLDRGIRRIERMTGVKAVMGGSHPGAGTRNALIALGGRQYLEIIAPDPAQTAYDFHIDVRTLSEPRLITWAAVTTDISAIAKNAREAGYQIFGPRDGSRSRPNGKVLQCKTLGVLNKFGVQGRRADSILHRMGCRFGVHHRIRQRAVSFNRLKSNTRILWK